MARYLISFPQEKVSGLIFGGHWANKLSLTPLLADAQRQRVTQRASQVRYAHW